MKKKVVCFALTSALAATCCAAVLTACGDKDKDVGFDKTTVFHVDLTMGTAIGPLSTLCNPGTLTFEPNGDAKMNITFTDAAKVMMDNMLGFRIADFVHDDTYTLNEDKTVISYHSTRVHAETGESTFGDQDVAVEYLSDNSMKIVYDIGKAIPNTVLYFYSNEAMMPKPEEPGEPEEPETFTLSYDLGGGVLAEDATLPEDEEFEEETEITLPEVDFSKAGHIFRGWAIYGIEAFGLYQPGDTYTVKSDVKFVAVWDETATYTFTDGNGLTQTFEAAIGSKIKLPECLFSSGDTNKGFAYWTQAGDTAQTKLYPNDEFTVEEDTEFVANFTNYITLTFTAGTGGEGTPYQIRIPASSRFVSPACNFAYQDDTKGFASWKINKTTYKTGVKFPEITADTTVEAQWDTFIEITFDANGSDGTAPANLKVVKGAYFELPECGLTTPEHARFAGWGTKAVANKTDMKQPGAMVYQTKATTYYAQWEYKRYVAFDTQIENKELEDGIIRAYANDKIVAPEMPFENGDKRFAFWGTSATATSGTKAGATITVPAGDALTTATYYAIWANKVTVSFDGGEGAVGSMDSLTSLYEYDNFTVPECGFTKDGYLFTGWKVGSTSYAVGAEKSVPAGGATLVAQWKQIETITFVGGEGATGTMDPVYTGTSSLVYLPECKFVKDGYVFDQWQNEKGKLFKAGASYVYGSNGLTLTATWKPVETITFKGGEGATGTTASVKGGQTHKVTLPNCTFQKAGYSFVGWQDANSNTYEAGAEFTVPEGGAELTAVWTESVTVKFVGGTGTTGTMADMYALGGKKFTLPECSFVKDGYAFVGWKDIEGNVYFAGSQMTLLSYEDEPTVTLKAVWGQGAYASYTTTFRAGTTSAIVGKDTSGKTLTLNDFMNPGAGSMAELILRPDQTADFVVKATITKDKFDGLNSGLSYSKFKSTFSIEKKNILYTYDKEANTVTLDMGNGETLVLQLKKVAKNDEIGYDNVQFEYTLKNKFGAVEKLLFAAFDGAPKYLSETKVFKGAVPADAPSFGGTAVTLTVNADGTGTLSASIMNLPFFHMFSPDMKSIIWLGDQGDRLEGTVGEANGKMTLSITFMGVTIILTEA